MTFKRHSQAEERRHSAIALVKLLLSESSELLPGHRREFLKLALWKITQAESGKYGTRFQSKISLSVSREELRHDHVFQRAIMIEAMLQATPEGIDDILENAVGCTVTKDEHDRLDQFKDLDGWERYSRAGIVVIATEAERPLEFPLQSN